ncbi:MAG: outer membrane lipoprotein carrier protein LolA [Alphaproteobacteria bacterium]|nr:outer membrane lipoprotein carrier protein LolA [Alphaproteobacteria bacterium]
MVLRFSHKVIFIAVMLLSVPLLSASAQDSLTEYQKADLGTITSYLNNLKNFQSRIRQINADNSNHYGILYVSRPGRMRLDYFPPVNYQLLASAKHFTLVDTTTNLATHYPFFSTPASLLLEKNINLNNKKIKIVNIERKGNRLILTLAGKKRNGAEDGNGRMIMVFSALPLQLLGWHVLDANNNRVSVVLEEIWDKVSFKKKNFFRYIEDSPKEISKDIAVPN